MESRDRGRLDPAAIHVHIAEITFHAHHEPFPLEIVTDLTTRDQTRLIVAGVITSHQIVSVQIRSPAVTELSSYVQTEVKALPIASRWNRRNDFIFAIFVIADWLGSSECGEGQNGNSEKSN